MRKLLALVALSFGIVDAEAHELTVNFDFSQSIILTQSENSKRTDHVDRLILSIEADILSISIDAYARGGRTDWLKGSSNKVHDRHLLKIPSGNVTGRMLVRRLSEDLARGKTPEFVQVYCRNSDEDLIVDRRRNTDQPGLLRVYRIYDRGRQSLDYGQCVLVDLSMK